MQGAAQNPGTSTADVNSVLLSTSVPLTAPASTPVILPGSVASSSSSTTQSAVPTVLPPILPPPVLAVSTPIAVAAASSSSSSSAVKKEDKKETKKRKVVGGDDDSKLQNIQSIFGNDPNKDRIFQELFNVSYADFLKLERAYNDKYRNNDRNKQLATLLFVVKFKPEFVPLAVWIGVGRCKSKPIQEGLQNLQKALLLCKEETWARGILDALNESHLKAFCEKGNYPAIKVEYAAFIDKFSADLRDKIKEILPNPTLKKASAKKPRSDADSAKISSVDALKADEKAEDLTGENAAASAVGKKNIKPVLLFTHNFNVMHSHKQRSGLGNIEPTFVEGVVAHKQLKQHLERMAYAVQATGDSAKQERNIAVATLTFLVSKMPLDVRTKTEHYGSVPVSFNVCDEGEGFKLEHDITTHRHEVDEIKNALRGQSGIRDGESAAAASKASDHHSEMALYIFLLKNIGKFVDKLKKHNKVQNKNGYRVYAVVLDIHSTNSMCGNCLPLTLGMYGTEIASFKFNFLDTLRSELTKKGFVTVNEEKAKPKRLRLLVRYSFDDPFPNPPSKRYTAEATEFQEHQLRDIKELSDMKVVLHQPYPKDKNKQEQKKKPPKMTLFFSGSIKKDDELSATASVAIAAAMGAAANAGAIDSDSALTSSASIVQLPPMPPIPTTAASTVSNLVDVRGLLPKKIVPPPAATTMAMSNVASTGVVVSTSSAPTVESSVASLASSSAMDTTVETTRHIM